MKGATRGSSASPTALLALAGALLAAACGVDPRPAAWEYISPVILQPTCATSSCHSRAAAVAGLDFSDPERGYTSLTGLKVWVVDPQGTDGCMLWEGTTVVCQRNHRPLVTPFNPEQSRLVNMLRARGATRMPPDRPLTEADIQLVETWIRNGALYRQPRPGDPSEARVPTVVVVTVAPSAPDAGADPPADADPPDAELAP
jgi:hypothetical protein